MAGRAYGPRFLWSWPASRIAVMGGEQAAGVLVQVRREAEERAGRALSDAEAEAIAAPVRAQFAQQSHALYASARLWDDGIVDPRRTREVLALSLRASLNAPIAETRFGLFRM
jgi:3-methylcrotonyl-CoA carboxylase beta subunit